MPGLENYYKSVARSIATALKAFGTLEALGGTRVVYRRFGFALISRGTRNGIVNLGRTNASPRTRVLFDEPRGFLHAPQLHVT